MAVANAAARALERALIRSESRRQEMATDRLVARLRHVFPTAQISRDAELRGASTHAWNFDAIVRSGNDQAVFDLVTPHPASVAFASTKFHDVAHLDHAPARVAVVRRKSGFGDLLAVVSQAARVVEEDASDRSLTRAADLPAAA